MSIKTEDISNYLDALITGMNSTEYFRSNNISGKDSIDIMFNAKKLLAYASLDAGKSMRGACYDCIHRGTIPGDAHSCCHNILAIAFGEEHGIRNGWFFHPFNFDPIWLRYCDGFEAKKKPE